MVLIPRELRRCRGGRRSALRRRGRGWNLLAVLCLALTSPAWASPTVDRLHFLIPAGAGGGWDGTARAVGRVLSESGLVAQVSFENLSGGGGGRAIARFVETAPMQIDTLLVSSTPIVIRALQGVYPHSFRDLTPVAAVIADYGAFAVRADSHLETWDQVVAILRADPRSLRVGGGSVRGNMDHLVASMAVAAAGGDPRRFIYVPYDAGGKAVTGLLAGEVHVLSTGVGEIIELARSGDVRVLAVTSSARLESLQDVPTLEELGFAVTFANWRGFFGPPGLPEARREAHIEMLARLRDVPAWNETRDHFGWEDLFVAGDAFTTYLEAQERELTGIMSKLGFLR
jgi:putative tricarboxylic transport membrane protein